MLATRVGILVRFGSMIAYTHLQGCTARRRHSVVIYTLSNPIVALALEIGLWEHPGTKVFAPTACGNSQ